MNDNAMKEIFSNDSYCKDELLRIRESFGNKNTFNESSIAASRDTLAWMYLYCPEDLMSLVDATMIELERREQYLLFRGLK